MTAVSDFQIGVPTPPHHAACPLMCQIFPECSTPRPEGAEGFDAGVLYERQRILFALKTIGTGPVDGCCPPGRATFQWLRDFIVDGRPSHSTA